MTHPRLSDARAQPALPIGRLAWGLIIFFV